MPSPEQILIVVGVGVLASLLYGLLAALCSRLGKLEPPPESPADKPEPSDEGLVRAAGVADRDESSTAEEIAHRVAYHLRREIRREFERSFWAAVGLSFFFYLIGSATAWVISFGL